VLQHIRAPTGRQDVTFVESEIASQPDCWREAAERVVDAAGLPAEGERVAVVGCGTSWFVAQAYAGLREESGNGETDAFTASEFPIDRSYDRVLAITRSGTTTEVVDLLRTLRGRVPTTTITGDGATDVVELSDDAIVLEFADEQSVVQTRFATSTLALLRASLGGDIASLIPQAQEALAEAIPADLLTRRQYTFLASGWAIGIANEAALKMREASLSWTEAYPSMEYRHGPMSITDDTSAVWIFGEPPAGLVQQVTGMGGMVVNAVGRDPMADLIRAQRVAVAIGLAKGQNPDQPRNLARSVILTEDPV
jgi:fructoselysine-6-P-deglycase FrlB-like protein